jgi:hypothetical protein
MSKNSLVAIGLGLVLILAFVLGCVLFKKNDAPPTETFGNPASNAPASAGAAAPTPAANPHQAQEPTLADLLDDFTSPIWRTMNNGCATDITTNEIRIHGVTQYADWAHGNGIVATTAIPDGDFTFSVDIKIAKFEGNTPYKNPYLRVEARDRSALGIYANPAYYYCMHDWKNPQTMSGTHKMFGDEATAYHRLSLRWQDGNGNAIATIDKELIGTIHTNLGSGRKISLFANTQTKGVDLDVYFRNLKVEIPDSQ